MIRGVADRVDSTSVHGSVGVNGPLRARLGPVDAGRWGTEGARLPNKPRPVPDAVNANGIAVRTGVLNRIYITRITVTDRHL